LLLLLAVLALVLGFRSSDNLGAAYGIAVTGTMTLDGMLALVYMVGVVGWNPVLASMLFGFFMTVDLAFFAANLLKVDQGGWFPLLVGGAVLTVMTTWMSGRAILVKVRAESSMRLDSFLANFNPERIRRVPGTAVFMTGDAGAVPHALLHNLKHNKVLHERVVLMNVPNIPRALAQCRVLHFHFNLMETSFFLRREKIVAKPARFVRWRKQLFILMSNTMLNATEFFR